MKRRIGRIGRMALGIAMTLGLGACDAALSPPPPVAAAYGPFSFVSGCVGRAEIADPGNPLTEGGLASFDGRPYPNDAYLLFPEARDRGLTGDTPPKFDVAMREEPAEGLSVLYSYSSSCLHRFRVTGGQVRLAERQGAALTGPALRDTDAAVAAWREAEVAACAARDPRSAGYEDMCETYPPGDIMEAIGADSTVMIPMHVSGPDVAIPARAARLGFEVDGALYAVTFFGDRVAVDRLSD